MDNYCVICGEIIPEGIIVCPICEKTVMDQSRKRGGIGFDMLKNENRSEENQTNKTGKTSWMKHGS